MILPLWLFAQLKYYDATFKGITVSQDLWVHGKQALQHTASCWLQKQSTWTSVCVSQFIVENGSTLDSIDNSSVKLWYLNALNSRRGSVHQWHNYTDLLFFMHISHTSAVAVMDLRTKIVRIHYFPKKSLKISKE